MRRSFQEIVRYLACPDDKSSLDYRAEALVCNQCGRIYPVVGGELVELLPREPAVPAANRDYEIEYHRQFHRVFESGDSSMAWGTPESSSSAWMRKRERQGSAVLQELMGGDRPLNELVLCDVSAGPGNYTLSYAAHCKYVLHCDLSVDSLQYALRRSRRMNVANVFFLRVDYFALPFRQSLDRILCLDTLIRGRDHEKALLGQVQGALAREGRAIVDFHYWWHNPLRRLGLLPQNFGQNESYTRRDSERLLRESGIEEWRYIPFYQEFEPTNSSSKTLLSVLPPTRLLYEFGSSRSIGGEREEQVRSRRAAAG
jgi:SAM-dependent methyltransferase/uncharacterized protein YbaR (Trm112 family)